MPLTTEQEVAVETADSHPSRLGAMVLLREVYKRFGFMDWYGLLLQTLRDVLHPHPTALRYDNDAVSAMWRLTRLEPNGVSGSRWGWSWGYADKLLKDALAQIQWRPPCLVISCFCPI